MIDKNLIILIDGKKNRTKGIKLRDSKKIINSKSVKILRFLQGTSILNSVFGSELFLYDKF